MSLAHFEHELAGAVVRLEALEMKFRRDASTGLVVPLRPDAGRIDTLENMVARLTHVVERQQVQIEQLTDILSEAGLG